MFVVVVVAHEFVVAAAVVVVELMSNDLDLAMLSQQVQFVVGNDCHQITNLNRHKSFITDVLFYIKLRTGHSCPSVQSWYIEMASSGRACRLCSRIGCCVICW